MFFMGDRKEMIRLAAGHAICIFFALLFTLAAYRNTGRIHQEELRSFYYYDFQLPEDMDRFTSIYDDSIAKTKNICVIRDVKNFGEGVHFIDFSKGKEQQIRSMIVQIRDGLPFDSECTFFYQTRDRRTIK